MMGKNVSHLLIIAISLVLLDCQMPVTTPDDDTITNLAIHGVAAPIGGAVPVDSIDSTDQFTGTVTWSPAATTFIEGIAYTATITLSPMLGYTLNGVIANSFTVDLATRVTHSANSGVVVAEFSITPSIVSPNIGNLMVVPAGSFQRDAIAENISVIGNPFRMSQHEITRTQFLTMMGIDPSDITYSNGINDPVQRSNWYHALAFCNKLSLAESLTLVYSVTESGIPVNWSTLTYDSIPRSSNADWNAATANLSANGYRLPTEMEWMWAAMGAPTDGQEGETNTTGYTKAFAGSNGSNSIADYAWYVSNSSSKTHPAMTKEANELGLYDMSGNVWEWCWDWYATYPSGTQTNYQGAASGSARVRRGGSWVNIASYCTVEYRDYYDQGLQTGILGFRVVRP